jgi:hypothetical protein
MEEVRLLEGGLTKFLLDYRKEMIKARVKGLYLDISQDWIDQMGEYHPKTRLYYAEEVAECVTL